MLSLQTSRRSRSATPTRVASVVAISVGLAMLLPQSPAGAAEPVGLGAAESFAVLAGSGITNTGPTTVWGDIGTFPTTSESGVDQMTIGGVDHAGDAVTQQAKTDLNTAYNDAAGALDPASVAVELGGETFEPGVYSGATLEITGTMTLDTLGDPDAVFIFQTDSTLVTASDSSVVFLNGATSCNVYWQVASSATLGVDSHLVGTVLADTSITATTGATVEGRLLALGGAVTLDTNTITNTGCAAPTGGDTTGGDDTTGGTTGGTTGEDTTGGSSTPTGAATPDLTPAAPTPGTDLTGATPPAVPVTPTRPALPYTGIDPWVPLVGALLVALGGVALVQSGRLTLAHSSTAGKHIAR